MTNDPARVSSESFPLVSVITPTYNRAGLLPETIESVLDQDYPNLEYIILDDGSTDNTEEILKPYLERVTYVKHANMGETQTVNKGFRLAKGEYVVVINSDDPFYRMDAVSLAVQCFRDNLGAEAVYPDWIFIDENSKPRQEMIQPEYNIHNMLLSVGVSMGPGMFIKLSALREIGYRDETVKYTGDLDVSFRLALRGGLVHLNEIIATHREHSGSISNKGQGKGMASDVARLYETSLLSPLLPEDLRRQKKRILANAYLNARRYCGEDRKARREYLIKAVMHDPLYVVRETIKKHAAKPESMPWPASKFSLHGIVALAKRILFAPIRYAKKLFLTPFRSPGNSNSLNVLFVTYIDSPGERFNGVEMAAWLRRNGHSAEHFVARKLSPDSLSTQLPASGKLLSRLAAALDNRLCVQSIFGPTWLRLLFRKEFRNADVVHYHLLHPEPNFLGLLGLFFLSWLRPSVWTLHDPWPTTGHCVHPMQCEQWKTHCENCPHPEWPMAVPWSNVGRNFTAKRRLIQRSNLYLHTLSNWMYERTRTSPITCSLPCSSILPGVDLDVFCPSDKAAAKQHFGIPSDAVVLAFRSAVVLYKGLPYLVQALKKIKHKDRVWLLTCQEEGNITDLQNMFSIKECGMIAEPTEVARFLNAADIHLMPSIAETFGMMGMEAAACGVPNIVFTGTALPDVCGGIACAVPAEWANADALAEAIDTLIADAPLREKMGQNARDYAVRNYGFEESMRNMLNFYINAVIPYCSERAR